MAEIPKADYPCTQSELYATVRLLLTNYTAKQTDFAAFKAKYTAAYGTTFSGEVDAAEALPDEETRNSTAETLRVQLIPLNRKCLDNWQILKQYVTEVYLPAEQKPNLQAAGSHYYAGGGKLNWENTVTMNVNATGFMTTNNTKLLDGGNNMPAGFQAIYDADALAFKNKYDAFVAAMETSDATADKIIANNALNKKALSMCADGQTVYMNDATKAKLFTWHDLSNIITPPGSSSLTVRLVLDESGLPAAGASVTVTKSGTGETQTLTANANGEALISPLEPHDYDYEITLTGRKTRTGVKHVDAGVKARLNVRMELPGVTLLDAELAFPIPSGISEIDLTGITMEDVAEVEISNTGGGSINGGFGSASSSLPTPATVTAGASVVKTPAELGFGGINTRLFLVSTGATTFRVQMRS